MILISVSAWKINYWLCVLWIKKYYLETWIVLESMKVNHSQCYICLATIPSFSIWWKMQSKKKKRTWNEMNRCTQSPSYRISLKSATVYALWNAGRMQMKLYRIVLRTERNRFRLAFWYCVCALPHRSTVSISFIFNFFTSFDVTFFSSATE